MYFDDGFNPVTQGAETFLNRLRAGWRPSESDAMKAAHHFRTTPWEWENILAPTLTVLAEFDADDQHEFWLEVHEMDGHDQKSMALIVARWAETARVLSDPVNRQVLLGDLDESEFVEVPRPVAICRDAEWYECEDHPGKAFVVRECNYNGGHTGRYHAEWRDGSLWAESSGTNGPLPEGWERCPCTSVPEPPTTDMVDLMLAQVARDRDQSSYWREGHPEILEATETWLLSLRDWLSTGNR